MTTTLFILNDAPYGSELVYNGLRLAGALAKRPEQRVRVFLMGDAASCARAGQKVPSGFYNVELMLKAVLGRGGEVRVCGTCMDARGLASEALMEGAARSTLDELTDWTVEADKVLVF